MLGTNRLGISLVGGVVSSFVGVESADIRLASVLVAEISLVSPELLSNRLISVGLVH